MVSKGFPVFVIDSIFNPRKKTRRSILIYVNEIQLIYGKDYEFDENDAFVTILSKLSVGDNILIKDYSDTDGCYVPVTPSKLGLYPLYEPMIYIDDTHREIIKNLDGTDTDATQPVKQFIEALRAAYPGIPVETIDERLSSHEAQQSIISAGAKKSKRANKGLIDAVSAAIILQTYLQKIS